MNPRKLSSLIIIAATALSIMSCKKDDDNYTVSPSLNGSLSYYIPTYLPPNAEVTLKPSGVTHPDGKNIGYYWRVSPTMTKSDTTRYENGKDKYGNPSDGSFHIKFSDTLRTYTVTGYAYAKDYTYTNRSKEVMLVKGGIDGSITNLHLGEMYHVEIDGKTYRYATIGEKDWLCRNISDETAGVPYENCKAMSDVFGRYYSFEEAVKVCPDGWSLPTEEDWVNMAKELGADAKPYETISGIASQIMGDAYLNGYKMWEYSREVGEITNKSWLSMIPAGYAMLGIKNDSPEDSEYTENIYPQANFLGYLEYAAFWTSEAVADNSEMAYYRYLVPNQPDLMIGKADKTSFGASVRCVR